MQRRSFFLAAPLFTLALPMMPAQAAAPVAYTDAAFAAAQQAGKPILLHVTAPWCPTCTAQKPILDKLTADPALKDLVFLTVDFDTSKDLLRKLRVQAQSTLIVYHGATERGRSAGDTNATSITALVRKSLG